MSNTAIDSILDKDAGLGFEGVTAQDMALPFLAILQKLSPQCDETSGKHVRGAKPGMLFNTVTKDVYDVQKNPMDFICAGFKKLWVEWRDRQKGGGFVAMHGDPSILEKTKKNERGQDVLENGNIIVTTAYHFGKILIDKDRTQQAVIAMSSTQLKKSREWISNMNAVLLPNGRVAPMYRCKYKISTVLEKNDKGSWFGWKIESGGPIENVAIIQSASEFGNSIRKDALLLTTKSTEALEDDELV